MQIKFWYFLSLGIIVLDIIAKILTEGVDIPIIDGVLSFISVHNIGASWGVLGGAQWLFITLAIVFIVGMIAFDTLFKKDFGANIWYKLGFTCILGGIIGNMIDRVFLGYVRDFISLDFINFPVFNIADIALTVGCVCIVVFILFYAFKTKKDTSNGKN